MVASLGAEFQASATFDNVQSVAPVFETAEPEVTVTVNPHLLNGVDGGSLLEGVGPQALNGPVQNEGIIGGLMGAMETIANDVRDAGNQIMNQQQQAVVEVKPILDTSLTTQETQYTHAAMEPPPAPSMA